MPVEGIDVSIYQGTVDWTQVRASGRLFAIAKASDGSSTVDPRFAQNWAGIQGAGLLRGAYHYAHPGQDAATQAAFFFSQFGSLGPGDLPPALDLEQNDGQSNDAVIAWAQAFLQKLETLCGQTPIVYTGGFWKFQLGNPTVSSMGQSPLWLAQYATTFQCPNSWTAPTFWQYSGSGTVPGISGNCDLDRFLGDESALRAMANAPPTSDPGPVVWSRYLVWPSTPIMAGPDVVAWQTRANTLSAGLQVDGMYGSSSKYACQVLQKHFGLTVDGIVGPKTWAATFGTS